MKKILSGCITLAVLSHLAFVASLALAQSVYIPPPRVVVLAPPVAVDETEDKTDIKVDTGPDVDKDARVDADTPASEPVLSISAKSPATPSKGVSVIPSTINSPGGLFVGAYIEDAKANPEDPTAGLIYLNLPEGPAAFSGLMNFTFVGCQSKSYGVVKGDKKLNELRGSWSGKLDHTTQNGAYEGAYNAEEKYYAGTYTVNNGKQLVVVPRCVQYYVSPRGTWLLLAPNQTFSTAKKYRGVDLKGLTATWQVPANSQYGGISIIDKELATAKLNATQITGNTQNAIVFAQMLTTYQTTYSLPALALKSGKTYVLSVIYANEREVTYASNKEFVAP